MQWLMTIPVISTCHLPESVVNNLPQDELYAEYDNGFFIHFGPEYSSRCEELMAIAQWAESEGFQWVRLDSDGDVIDELPKFDW